MRPIVMAHRFLLAASLLLPSAGLTLLAGPAAAYPDARVEAKITPSFAGLLSPPISRPLPHRRPRSWTWRVHSGAHDRRHGGHGPNATVDCADPRRGPTPVTDALDRLEPGGTLYIRGSGICRETVEIWQSVTIIGEGGSAFEPDRGARASIAAPAGRPCLVIAPGVRRVELRDIQLVSERGGRSACIEAEEADIALVRSSIRYSGDDAAVYIGGGRLILRDSTIDAPQAYAGLVVQDAVLVAEQSQIRAAALGIDLSPGGREPSRLAGLSLTGPGLSSPAARRATGLLVRGGAGGAGAPQRLSVVASSVDGWGRGVWLDYGAGADISASHIRRTLLGVLIDGADATVTGSQIGARETGVQVASGRARIDDNDIYGYIGQAIAVGEGAQVSGHNRYWPRMGCSGAQGDAECRPMGYVAPDMRDDDNGWGPAPAMADPQPPRRRGWGR